MLRQFINRHVRSRIMSDATFSDLSDRELSLVAESLKGTTWLAIFSRVSKACRDASTFVEEDEAALSRLNVCDLVGSVELVTWALDQGCPHWRGANRIKICWAAARGGHLETLKWLRTNAYEWKSETCSSAAHGGHLEVLKWARANGCEWDGRTCSSAARGGHLEVLKWARANGCEWDWRTCSSAAHGGHLEVLKWARANGCEWGLENMFLCCRRRPPGGPEVAQGQWLRVECGNVFLSSPRPSGGPEMGQGQWLQLECVHMCHSSPRRPSGGPQMGQGQWLRVECVHVFLCSPGRLPGGPEVGQGQWLQLG